MATARKRPPSGGIFEIPLAKRKRVGDVESQGNLGDVVGRIFGGSLVDLASMCCDIPESPVSIRE